MTAIDRLIIEFDKGLRTLFSTPVSVRAVPGDKTPEAALSAEDRQHAAALMRVNHVGEVCAQALYQGQAMTARDPEIRTALEVAAHEETEHLAWTEQRIHELGGRKSLLNPLWYSGALALGLLAGRLGNRWNLGFLAETERQVEAHLDYHLEVLPEQDERSRQIVAQMRDDEIRHADMAIQLGGAPLPLPVKGMMRFAARLMTKTAYRI